MGPNIRMLSLAVGQKISKIFGLPNPYQNPSNPTPNSFRLSHVQYIPHHPLVCAELFNSMFPKLLWPGQ